MAEVFSIFGLYCGPLWGWAHTLPDHVPKGLKKVRTKTQDQKSEKKGPSNIDPIKKKNERPTAIDQNTDKNCLTKKIRNQKPKKEEMRRTWKIGLKLT